MKRSAAWDAALGAALFLGMLAASLLRPPLFEGAEFALYDAYSKTRQDLRAADEVVVVSLDEGPGARGGGGSWPRWRLAAVVDRLASAGAKVIGLGVPLSEDESNPGLGEVKRLRERYEGLLSSKAVLDRKKAFDVEFSSAIMELDADSKLEAALRRAGNVVLPFLSVQGGGAGAAEGLPAAAAGFALSRPASAGEPLPRDSGRPALPLARFTAVSAGAGHAETSPESDGVLRRERPVLRAGDRYLPSYAVAVSLAYLGLKPQQAALDPGRSLSAGKLTVPLDAESRMLISYTGPEQTFQYVSADDLLREKVSPGAFQGKIVLVGPSASAAAALAATPLTDAMPAIEVAANVIENILHGRFLRRPPWAGRLELALLAAAGLFVMLVLPRLKILPGFVVSLMLAAGMVAAASYLFFTGTWVKVAYPCLLLALGALLAAGKRSFVARTARELPRADRAGLRNLGRYAVEKELRRDAEGALLLGRDAESGRPVVLRTWALCGGGSPESSQAAKDGFLREARSAIALDHPNISRVLDAGEGGGGVYLAMDAQDGHDLTRYTASGDLLPVPQVLEHVAAAAAALDYAHARGVVHRGISPASLILLKDGTVRVTDFGFARGAFAAQAPAGPVAGVPCYMSPEALAGRKVDGRSDLFSLAATLFELLTARKPFQGGEGIGPLLFQITNDPHPDPRSIRPSLPACVVPIIDKGLAKSPDERYARGALMAADLRAAAAAAAADGRREHS